MEQLVLEEVAAGTQRRRDDGRLQAEGDLVAVVVHLLPVVVQARVDVRQRCRAPARGERLPLLVAVERVAAGLRRHVDGTARRIQHVLAHVGVARGLVPRVAQRERGVPRQRTPRAIQGEALVVVVGRQVCPVDVAAESRVVPAYGLEVVAEIAREIARSDRHRPRRIAHLERGVVGLVLLRNREVDITAARARRVGRRTDLGAGELDLVAVDAEIPRRLLLPLEVAASVLALDSEVYVLPVGGVWIRKRRLQRRAAAADVRRHAVEHEIVRNPVGIGAGLEHVVQAAAQVDVHVVTAEVLAVGVDPRLAVASLDAERRQHPVAQVLVFVELGEVVPGGFAVGVRDDAAGRHLPRRQERVGRLSEHRGCGKKRSDQYRQLFLAHDVLLAP